MSIHLYSLIFSLSRGFFQIIFKKVCVYQIKELSLPCRLVYEMWRLNLKTFVGEYGNIGKCGFDSHTLH